MVRAERLIDGVIIDLPDSTTCHCNGPPNEGRFRLADERIGAIHNVEIAGALVLVKRLASDHDFVGKTLANNLPAVKLA